MNTKTTQILACGIILAGCVSFTGYKFAVQATQDAEQKAIAQYIAYTDDPTSSSLAGVQGPSRTSYTHYNNKPAGYNNKPAGYNNKPAGYNNEVSSYNNEATTSFTTTLAVCAMARDTIYASASRYEQLNPVFLQQLDKEYRKCLVKMSM